MNSIFKPAYLSLLIGLLLSMSAVAIPWHAAERNTRGWQFMTPDERTEHQRHMRSFDTFEQCIIYQKEHHALMEQRALKAGVVLQPKPESGCAQLQKNGSIK